MTRASATKSSRGISRRSGDLPVDILLFRALRPSVLVSFGGMLKLLDKPVRKLPLWLQSSAECNHAYQQRQDEAPMVRKKAEAAASRGKKQRVRLFRAQLWSKR